MAFGAVRRVAELVLGADDRQLAKGLRRARKRVSGFARDSGGFLKSALGPIGALGSVAGLAAVADDAFRFHDAVTRLGIQANLSATQTKALTAEMEALSNETGLSTNVIAGGAAKFVSLTGDIDGARASMNVFARTSVATGASLEDVAATAAALKRNLGVAPEDMEAALSGLVVQGKAGAIELRELAGLLSSIAPQMTQFANSGSQDMLSELGAALQVVRSGFGSGAEAVTGMNALFTALSNNAARFREAGVHVFNKDPKTGVKTFKRFSEIVRLIGESKLMKDPERLGNAFGSNEAKRAFDQLHKAPELMHQLYNESLKGDAIQRDYFRYQESAAGKMRKAWNAMKNAVAQAFTPERIAMFAAALEKALGAAEKIGGALKMIFDPFGFLDEKDYTKPKATSLDPKGTADSREIQSRQLLIGAAELLKIPVAKQGVAKTNAELESEIRDELEGRGPRGSARELSRPTDAQSRGDAQFTIEEARRLQNEADLIRKLNAYVATRDALGGDRGATGDRVIGQMYDAIREFTGATGIYRELIDTRERQANALFNQGATALVRAADSMNEAADNIRAASRPVNPSMTSARRHPSDQ